MRARSPPSVTRTTCRSVWSSNPASDQLALKPTLGRCGAAAHAADQLPALAPAGRGFEEAVAPVAASPATRASAAAATTA
ncbi:hypothetical protein RB200_09270 [Streptomyces sp. PmtG]